MKPKTLIILFTSVCGIIIVGSIVALFILLSIANKKPGDTPYDKPVYEVTVFNPGKQSNDVYLSDTVQYLPEGIVTFKDSKGVTYFHNSINVTVVKY